MVNSRLAVRSRRSFVKYKTPAFGSFLDTFLKRPNLLPEPQNLLFLLGKFHASYNKEIFPKRKALIQNEIDTARRHAILVISMEIKKQELKEILREQRKEYQSYLHTERKEYQHYLGALKEDFDSKVELIAEQYLSIKERLSSHGEMIASIKEDIEIMKVDVAFIKGGLKQKVDTEEFEVLERRVALLEAKAR